MIVPEEEVKDGLDKIFNFIKADFDSKPTEEETYLYKVLGLNDKLKLTSRYDFFKQAKTLFASAPDGVRKIDTHLFFNADKANTPSIHIMSAVDNPTEIGLGGNEGYQPGIQSGDENEYLNEMFTTGYNSNIPIVFTSENPSEVLMMYYFVRHILVPMFNHFEQIGMKNCKVMGAPIAIQELPMPNVFAKQLTLSYYSEVNSVNFYTLAQINSLNFIQILQDGFTDNSVSNT